MARTESLNDFIPKHFTLPRIRVAAIRDLISEAKQDLLPREEILNQVRAYCIDKNLETDSIRFDMDDDIESIAVTTGDTTYYFKL